MTTPDESAAFRRQAAWVFGCAVLALAAVAAGLAWLGWCLGDGWGLAGGAAAGLLLFFGGLTGATLLYAMSQDGA